MLMTSVIDIHAFHKDSFEAPGYRDQARMLLRGVSSNGLVVVDCQGRLQRGLADAISVLPTKHGQELSILLEELLKNKRKRFIKCHPDSCTTCSTVELLNLACRVKACCCVDGLITSDENANRLKSNGQFDSNVILLSEYIPSEFEKRRFYFREQMPPLDQLSKKDIDEAIIRITKFAKWLRFYDKQIGKGINTSHFRKGIQYILELWRKHGHFSSHNHVEFIEIITCTAEDVRDGEGDYARQSKKNRNQEAFEKITRELVEPLKKEFGWKISLRVKEDPRGIFHARHLEAQAVAVLFDRGFDLFIPDGEFKRNFVRIETAAYDHLYECRRLTDAFALTI